jgi:S-adenosyl-L-methionine hydrolase (adenosine-forming)
MPALITLTTDFGTRDPYLAQMKGVLLSNAAADVRIVDLSHDLQAFDINEAALFMRAAVSRFPADTIHLVVVDPGVGSSRRPLVARSQGQIFVGPDNGVFGYVLDRSPQVHAIDPVLVSRTGLSSTFHGRDLFAPAAAMLANGCDIDALGPRLESFHRLVFPMVEIQRRTLIGRVVHIDRFGNLTTNVPRGTLDAFLADHARDAVVIQIADREIRGVLEYYGQAKPGELLALVGSSDLLEVAARESSAAARLGAVVGCSLRLTV